MEFTEIPANPIFELDGVILESHMEGDIKVIDKIEVTGVSLVGHRDDQDDDLVPKSSDK